VRLWNGYCGNLRAASLDSFTICAAHFDRSVSQQDIRRVPISVASAIRCCRFGFLEALASRDENLTLHVAFVLLPTGSHSTLLMLQTTSLRPTVSIGVKWKSGDCLNAVSTATVSFWDKASSPVYQNSTAIGVETFARQPQKKTARLTQMGRHPFDCIDVQQISTVHLHWVASDAMSDNANKTALAD
jgi:hypothetical protein